jgi:hypothetical protein
MAGQDLRILPRSLFPDAREVALLEEPSGAPLRSGSRRLESGSWRGLGARSWKWLPLQQAPLLAPLGGFVPPASVKRLDRDLRYPQKAL